jgi:hypothetical protein
VITDGLQLPEVGVGRARGVDVGRGVDVARGVEVGVAVEPEVAVARGTFVGVAVGAGVPPDWTCQSAGTLGGSQPTCDVCAWMHLYVGPWYVTNVFTA